MKNYHGGKHFLPSFHTVYAQMYKQTFGRCFYPKWFTIQLRSQGLKRLLKGPTVQVTAFFLTTLRSIVQSPNR